ncbi:MAG: NAD(P)-binding domain-containing protein [Euryarchaeota archaeon]|nr:NAD(P)-binding domain-containing protein [Euryarchaeota archaeon]
MKIAILGGTGHLGKGFALRWGQMHDVIIGSRNAEKASRVAAEYTQTLNDRGIDTSIEGTDNRTAAERADIIIVSVRYEQMSSLIELIHPVLDHQIMVSVIVPMEKGRCYIQPESTPVTIDTSDSKYNSDYFCYMTPAEGSAALEMDALLPDGVELVSAFHNVPAKELADLDHDLEFDVLVCGNHMRSKKAVFKLVHAIPVLRPLDLGPLEASVLVESLTPLVINVAMRNKLKDVGIKFVHF